MRVVIYIRSDRSIEKQHRAAAEYCGALGLEIDSICTEPADCVTLVDIGAADQIVTVLPDERLTSAAAGRPVACIRDPARRSRPLDAARIIGRLYRRGLDESEIAELVGAQLGEIRRLVRRALRPGEDGRPTGRPGAGHRSPP